MQLFIIRGLHLQIFLVQGWFDTIVDAQDCVAKVSAILNRHGRHKQARSRS